MIQRSAWGLAVLAAVSAGVSNHAAAQSNSFYGIIGVGRSSLDVDGGDVDRFALARGLTSSTTSGESKDWGGKVQLGYMFNNSFGIEGGYMHLGTAAFNTTNNLYSARGEKKADLFNLVFVGRVLMTPQWSGLFRLGGYRWETDSTVPTTVGLVNQSNDGYDWMFGASVQYDFTPNFGLRGSFDRFNGIGSSDNTGDSKANLLSLDAVLKF